MPNHIKAYIFLLMVGCACYVLWKNANKKLEISGYGAGYVQHLSRQYFIAWVILTSCAFLAVNYYVFLLLSIVLVLFLRKRVPAHAQGGLYLVLLLGLPSLGKVIPGIFGLQQLFQSSWPLILGLVFVLTERKGKLFEIRRKVDWAIVLFFIIIGLLSFRRFSFTDGLRYAFLFFNMICVPYFIARKLSNGFAGVKFVFFGYVFVTLLMAAVAVFASLKHWNVYQTLNAPLGLKEITITGYKYRGGFLRASSMLGSIHLAIACFGAVIFYSCLASDVATSILKKAIFILLFLAIVLTFSRGPWLIGLGALVLYFAMDKGAKGLIYFLAGLAAFAVLLSLSGLLDSVTDGLALRDSGNIDYRQNLLRLGIVEFMKYPLFGNLDFRNAPAMQSLVQGEGIVDIVNTYLQVALAYGVVALGLFVYVMIFWPLSVYRNVMKNSDNGMQEKKIAKAYLAFMLCIAGGIFTVSTFNVGSVFFPLMMFLVGVGHGVIKD